MISVRDTKYLAISHVWGEVEWREVPGIDGQVLISKEKAKFMGQLKSIVGGAYFWMDILCVEQSDKAARIAITQHIPTIFRHAQRTIVIKDGTGLRDCCVQAMGNVDKWYVNNSQYREKLTRHYKTTHKGEEFRESDLIAIMGVPRNYLVR